MVFEIAGGTYNGWIFLWLLVPVALFVLSIVADWVDLPTASDVLAGIGTVVGMGVLFTTLAMFLSAPAYQENRQKGAALVELGFENVDYASGNFTASLDGDYFSGALVNLGDNTFQVVEKVAVKENND